MSGEERSGFDFKHAAAPVSHGDVGGRCQGETDGLGEWGGALGTGYDV